jgi:hypothetical protein
MIFLQKALTAKIFMFKPGGKKSILKVMRYLQLLPVLCFMLLGCGTGCSERPEPKREPNGQDHVDPRPFPLGNEHPWIKAAAEPDSLQVMLGLARRALADKFPGATLREELLIVRDFDRNFINDLLTLVDLPTPEGKNLVFPTIFSRGRNKVAIIMPPFPLVQTTQELANGFDIGYVDDFTRKINSELIGFTTVGETAELEKRVIEHRLIVYVYKNSRLTLGLKENLLHMEIGPDSPIAQYEIAANYAVDDFLSKKVGREILIYDRVERRRDERAGPVPEHMLYPKIFYYDPRSGLLQLAGHNLLGKIIESGAKPPRTLPIWLLSAANTCDCGEAEDLVSRISAIAGARFYLLDSKVYSGLPDDDFYIARPFIKWEDALKYQTLLEDRGADTELFLAHINH